MPADEGEIMDTRNGIENAFACQEICASSEICKFFLFNENNQDCHMFDHVHKARKEADPQTDFVAGPRVCPGFDLACYISV